MTTLIPMPCTEVGTVDIEPTRVTVWLVPAGQPFHSYWCPVCDHPHHGPLQEDTARTLIDHADTIRQGDLTDCLELVDPLRRDCVDARRRIHNNAEWLDSDWELGVHVPDAWQRWAVDYLNVCKAAEALRRIDTAQRQGRPAKRRKA